MLGVNERALLGLSALISLVSARSSVPSGRLEQSAFGVVPNEYIITLKGGLDASIVKRHMQWATSLNTRSDALPAGLNKHWNIGSWNAYSSFLDEGTAAQVSDREEVQFIEPNRVITPEVTISQADAVWGLRKISHKDSNHTDYVYDSKAGEGTYAYVLDTGVRTTHSEFQGRASFGYSVFGETDTVDDMGHRTHVSGTIGGVQYGVAKKAKIIAVKVLNNGFGSTADLLDGYTWAYKNITEEKREAVTVINISLTASTAEAVNEAVKQAYNNGVLTIAAAGNQNETAAGYSPASAPEAVTVGSIDEENTRSAFSNWGELVDIFAPGENVVSA
ncbi:extracellular alkaline serine protease [Whalleya microplaca]|nr:extracellular alkaline serine protease [Whalleya microplaca]